ncbi:MAG: DUF1616 domain-containing protein [Dehalococcoidales bacterium]|nr:DUF1616 domain-containing protein [Dehalococcoidales bacterium]
MRIKHTHILFCVIIISIVLVLIIQFFPNNISRIILGLPFILLFPGYTLVSILFPGKERLGGIERLALSFGLSLAVIPVAGLILNYTLGLSLNSVLYSLAGFVLLFSIIAIFRQRSLFDIEKHSFVISFAWFGRQSIAERILSVVLILVACGTVCALIYTIAIPKTGSAYSEFYVLNSQGIAGDYPFEITLGDTESVILVIVNHEKQTADYRIEIQIDNDPNDSIDTVTLDTIDNITLKNKEKHEIPASFTPQITGDGQKVYFLLFKDGYTEPYLELNLTINVN